MRRLIPCALLLAAAPATPVLQPGAWEVVNAPGIATLDGKALNDLPYTPPPPERVCLTGAEAAAPAAWLARDVPGDCVITRTALQGGSVDVRGTCPPPDDGQQRGTLSITGRFTATGYALKFATVAHGDNGTMGFTGQLTGKRVGDCP